SMTSQPVLPSPSLRRVGIRIKTFEACSGFTHVTARRIAQLPKATFVTRLRSGQLPSRTARQLPDPSTLIRVESSSTRETRLQGAHREFLSRKPREQGVCREFRRGTFRPPTPPNFTRRLRRNGAPARMQPASSFDRTALLGRADRGGLPCGGAYGRSRRPSGLGAPGMLQ